MSIYIDEELIPLTKLNNENAVNALHIAIWQVDCHLWVNMLKLYSSYDKLWQNHTGKVK